MADTVSEPPKYRQKQILERIQTHKHDVLTTSEIGETITEVSQKQIGRNLRWMMDHGVLGGRQAGDNDIWLWWVSAEGLSADESVATARQVQTLLENLYDNRWEFRLIGAGVAMLMALLTLSFWALIINMFSVEIASVTNILATIGVGFILAFLVILIGLFIFPIETLGNWPLATGNEE